MTCGYSSDTEFLTKSGFRKFNEIDINTDVIGTITKSSFKFEWQKPTSSHCRQADDDMILTSANYTNSLTSKTNKMLVSESHRTRYNNFSDKYDPNRSNWQLIECEAILAGDRSHYNTIYTPHDINQADYGVSDDLLKIIGSYVSEGSLIKYQCTKDKERTGEVHLKGISISQLAGNRLDPIMRSIRDYKVCIYPFLRKGRIENTYNIYGAEFANSILDDCGDLCRGKKLPNWVFALSSRQIDLLLETAIAGDGTEKKYSWCYYTTSYQLAQDIQLLAFHGGHVAKVWRYDYGKGDTFQVYITKEKFTFGRVNYSDGGGNTSAKRIPYDGNVVSFSVPNGLLVTRRNGEIGINGGI